MIGADVEILSDGEMVWVNGGSTGGAIGRFGKNGIDIHSEDTASCLHCTHSSTSSADYDTFVAKMLEHHGVVIGAEHRPRRFRSPAPSRPLQGRGLR